MAGYGILGAPGVLADEDDLLGLNTNIGMFDQSFRDAGRAPVNELFAGRNSAHINDADFDKRHADAARIVNNLRGAPSGRIATSGLTQSPYDAEESAKVRNEVYDKTGMHIYPGHVSGGNAKPAYGSQVQVQHARESYEPSRGQPGNPRKTPMVLMDYFSDAEAELMPNYENATTLGGILKHPELYRHYPEARSIGIEFIDRDSDYDAYYKPVDQQNAFGRIGLPMPKNWEEKEEAVPKLLHEVQHYIQHVEGWPNGTNLSAGADFKNRQRMNRLQPGVLAESRDPKYEAYANASGEILAREVENRYEEDRQHFRGLMLADEVINDPSADPGYKEMMAEISDSASESLLQEIDRPYIPLRNSRGNPQPDYANVWFAPYDQPVLGALQSYELDKARKAYGDVWRAFERKRVGATEGDAGEYNRLNEEWEKERSRLKPFYQMEFNRGSSEIFKPKRSGGERHSIYAPALLNRLKK